MNNVNYKEIIEVAKKDVEKGTKELIQYIKDNSDYKNDEKTFFSITFDTYANEYNKESISTSDFAELISYSCAGGNPSLSEGAFGYSGQVDTREYSYEEVCEDIIRGCGIAIDTIDREG